MNKALSVGVVVALVAALAVAFGFFRGSAGSEPVFNAEDAAVRAVVADVGSKMKDVSLLAPDAGAQIAAQYGSDITPELLAQWQADPMGAPGRQTSSPWPERIEVVEVTQEGDRATAEANIIEVANGQAGTEVAAVQPATFMLQKRAGQWLVSGMQKGAYAELPQRQTIVGAWECLPHKDTAGPVTLECAFGIAVDQSDAHYAVDTRLMAQHPVDFPTGTRVRATGIVTPAEALSSVQKYDIDGVISATSIERL
jgi:hypothetical protein